MVPIFPILHSRIAWSPDSDGNDQDSDVEENASNLTGWEIIYFSLLSLEKLFQAFPSLPESADTQELWSDIVELLLHPHQWIRLVSSRLLGILFSAKKSTTVLSSKENNNNNNNDQRNTFLSSPGEWYNLIKTICYQLESQHLTETLANQIAKNLVFTGKVLYDNPTVLFFEEDDRKFDGRNAIHWLFRRLSFIARHGVPIQVQSLEGVYPKYH
ncbi:U3 snoRNP protein [Coelomomyces lativittatus]|nr:U3 snoRNP protein [Coelomomyces lativittatus]